MKVKILLLLYGEKPSENATTVCNIIEFLLYYTLLFIIYAVLINIGLSLNAQGVNLVEKESVWVLFDFAIGPNLGNVEGIMFLRYLLGPLIRPTLYIFWFIFFIMLHVIALIFVCWFLYKRIKSIIMNETFNIENYSLSMEEVIGFQLLIQLCFGLLGILGIYINYKFVSPYFETKLREAKGKIIASAIPAIDMFSPKFTLKLFKQ
jgi:hypothetical protein